MGAGIPHHILRLAEMMHSKKEPALPKTWLIGVQVPWLCIGSADIFFMWSQVREPFLTRRKKQTFLPNDRDLLVVCSAGQEQESGHHGKLRRGYRPSALIPKGFALATPNHKKEEDQICHVDFRPSVTVSCST